MAVSWTPEMIAQVAGLHAESYSYQQIALELGVPRSAISGIVYRIRHPKPKRARKPITRENRPGTSAECNIPIKYPYAPDSSCPDFAWDDDHCGAVNALGGYPNLYARRAA